MNFEVDSTQPAGDFLELLKRSGYRLQPAVSSDAKGNSITIPQATTVLAFHFNEGVIIAGDRRATAGSNIMYERCDKVIPIDDYSLMAIAGVPATAFEMARILSHNFEYYRRSQMQTMSMEGKIRALSKLLKENVGMAMQGIGAVSPIFATYDIKQEKTFIYFYDMLGAEFQILTHVGTGSGSPMIRGIMEHENQWGSKPLAQRNREEAVMLSIRLLHTAAHFDSATGKARPDDDLYPIVAVLTKEGYKFVPDKEMAGLFKKYMTRKG